jgi:hypothetical protein
MAHEFGLSAAGYAEDHLNYLCTNWTRPTPLPCRPAVRDWQARWGGGVAAGVLQPQRFVVFAWWPPVPADYDAYAEVGSAMGCRARFRSRLG